MVKIPMVSSQDFIHPFLPQTKEQIEAMLKIINISTVEDLYSGIPSNLRFNGNLEIPDSQSEQETLQKIRAILSKNQTSDDLISFLGAGVYPHFIPSVVSSIINRSEFITSYTPYAPEVSQGMLQALWEYQSMIAELTQLDLVNSSMYDLATSLGEAALMSARVTRKDVFLVPDYIQPERFQTLLTYAAGPGLKIISYPCNDKNGQVDLQTLEDIITKNSENLCGVYVENPNFWGIIEEQIEHVGKKVHEYNALFIIGFDPISLGILKSPGDLGADIAIGEGQATGLPMSFGGPLLGLFAVRNDKKLARSMPGRIIGLTVEKGSSTRAFTMTLQTREQHIRREKATSNICTNNALCALASAVYLSLLGPGGLKNTADACIAKASYLSDHLSEIKGIKSPHFDAPFFKEFVFTFENENIHDSYIEFMKSRKIIPGLSLKNIYPNLGSGILTSVTEMITISDLDQFIEATEEFFKIQGGA
jgi:glycine dehydrogenase subunit 1